LKIATAEQGGDSDPSKGLVQQQLSVNPQMFMQQPRPSQLNRQQLQQQQQQPSASQINMHQLQQQQQSSQPQPQQNGSTILKSDSNQ